MATSLSRHLEQEVALFIANQGMPRTPAPCVTYSHLYYMLEFGILVEHPWCPPHVTGLWDCVSGLSTIFTPIPLPPGHPNAYMAIPPAPAVPTRVAYADPSSSAATPIEKGLLAEMIRDAEARGFRVRVDYFFDRNEAGMEVTHKGAIMWAGQGPGRAEMVTNAYADYERFINEENGRNQRRN